MINPRLAIADDILNGLKSLHERGAKSEELIWYLAKAGLSKPLATIALRRTQVMPSSETKEAVHFHPAYAFRQQSDEAFWESADNAYMQTAQVDSAA